MVEIEAVFLKKIPFLSQQISFVLDYSAWSDVLAVEME